jgi:hypothetical protein
MVARSVPVSFETDGVGGGRFKRGGVHSRASVDPGAGAGWRRRFRLPERGGTGRVGAQEGLRMSGIAIELIGIVVFVVVGALIFFSARGKATTDQCIGMMIVIAAFFVFFSAYTWKFIGF